MISIDSIRPNPDNPRTFPTEKLEKLKKSIRDFEAMLSLRPIVVDGEGMILGGNMRYEAMKELGYSEIPDEWVMRAESLTEEQKREFIIKDNVGFGTWDWDVLVADWDKTDLADWGPEVEEWRYPSLATEEDREVVDLPQTDIMQGDLIEIGPHRLLCGDATRADDVGKLLDGNEPGLMIADPPYGVSYDPMARKTNKAVGAISNDDRFDWTEAFSLFSGNIAYVWHASQSTHVVARKLETLGFVLRSLIIWNKSRPVISRGNYHWQHEPCWYAVKKGAKSQWTGSRKETTVWDIAHQRSETGHCTQKPVEAMHRPMRNHIGDVYDPFLGSGTTMVAAHQLGRTCYGLEIEPQYCQVVVNRMMKLFPDIDVKINGEAYAARVADSTT